jgi:hypothetical protein
MTKFPRLTYWENADGTTEIRAVLHVYRSDVIPVTVRDAHNVNKALEEIEKCIQKLEGES